MKFYRILLKAIFTLFLTFNLTLYVNSQDFDVQFEHLSIEDGLSQSSVFAILQDYKGFIWIGTHDGLNRYDGYNFLIFKNIQTDNSSISGNIIKAIFETSDSILLIGTFGNGLNIFNRNLETFTHFVNEPENPNSLSNNVIRCITEDKNGTIWIGTEGGGLNKFDIKTKTFISFQNIPDNDNSLCQNEVNDIAIDKNGNLWLATNGGLDMFDPVNQKFTHYKNEVNNSNSLSDNFLPCVIEDSKGKIWIGSRNGINLYNPDNKTFKRYTYNQNFSGGLCNSVVLKIMEDSQGYIWIGTSDGINIFDPKTETFYTYQHDSFNEKSLSHNNIASIYSDLAGIIWIGTWERGINKFDVKSKKFKLYRYSSSLTNSMPDKTIRSIFYDENDIIWLGFVEGGLVRFDRKQNLFDKYLKVPYNDNTLYDNTVSSIIRDKEGNLWIGTWNGGVHKAIFSADNTKIVSFEHFTAENSGLINSTIQKIFESSDGKLWIGTGGGLDVFDKISKTFTHVINFPYTEKGSIQGAIQEDKSGNIWVGSWGGLHKVTKNIDGTYTSQLYVNIPEDSTSINDNRIISLLIDNDGFIWAGTFGSGINKIVQLNNNLISCTHYNEDKGLANNVVYGIYEDKNHCLWMSTNKGISKLNINKEEFTNYDESDGLQSNEFFWGAGFHGVNDEIFFGGINGLNAFFPEDVKDNSYFPPIVITDFKMFNASVKIGYNSRLAKSITETNEIILNYDDEVISFEFSALHFSVPENNKYAYILEGFNKDWIITDANNRIATYTNLDPGKYVFKVKGSNSDGIWNETGIEISVIVKPPFWATWWFRTIAVLTVIGLIYWFIKFRINRINQQKVILEKLVKERTHEINMKNKELEQQKEEILTQSEELYKFNLKLEEQNKMVNFQNELITGSIRYAKTIQQSILPPQQVIDNYFENFLIYMPRNIVSGDFYWFYKVEHENGNELLFFATVDCTGHGVPGAFMSLISSRLLNEIVKENHIYQPCKILDALDKEIRISLNQDSTDNTDGLDIALCRIEKNKSENIIQTDYNLTFSGAKIPLFYYKFNDKLLNKYPSSKKHIGGVKVRNNDFVFSDFSINVSKNDVIYLCSDGYIDQNNKDRKRFGTHQLLELFNKCAEFSMAQQKNIIESALMKYQENQEQRDDITIWGIKF